MSAFEVGQAVFTINSRSTRATPGRVTEVTINDIAVFNAHKNETQFFDINEPHRALGDYWAEDDMRPRLVTEDDALARRLYREAQHRDWSERVRLAARRFHDSPSTRNYVELKETVEQWGNWVSTWQ